MKSMRIALIVACLLLAAGAGWWFWQSAKTSRAPAGTSHAEHVVNGVVQDDSGRTVLYWYDPMVPGQKFERPGKSPFMDMQLVPKYAAGAGEMQGAAVSIPAQTLQNLGIRYARVEEAMFGDKLRAVGRIEPDERRYYEVQTRIPGFVEKLLVRAVGDPVRRGQKIAEIYAPELLAAQQEYLALGRMQDLPGADSLQQAARERLRLLGMTEAEIAGITLNHAPTTRFGVYAPASGVLTMLGVREGAQLMAGAALMQIADLSRVWLIAEVPERDAARLKPGLAATVGLQSLPGAEYRGRIDYLYPLLDEVTRTVRVRIELANPHGKLRPGMYADVMLQGEMRHALAVPSESVIATGTRNVVIVREGRQGFRPAEVTTGEARDGRTEILAGLSAGEEVVASGQFLIDSEASLSGVLARLGQQMREEPAHADMAQPKRPQGTGKVVKVKTETGELTMAHDPIPELEWPAMTMDFRVQDGAQLRALRPGDPVRFELQLQDDEYVIRRIEKRHDLEAQP